jgi:hypothetical protein
MKQEEEKGRRAGKDEKPGGRETNLESVVKHVRDMSRARLQALKEGSVVVLHQLVSVIRVGAFLQSQAKVEMNILSLWLSKIEKSRFREDGAPRGMRTYLDDERSSVSRAESSDVGISLLGHDHIEVVLGLVDMRSKGDDARDPGGVRLGLSGRRSVHDGEFGVSKEVGRASDTVEHLFDKERRLASLLSLSITSRQERRRRTNPRSESVGRVGVGVHVDLEGSVHGDLHDDGVARGQ